MIDASAASRVVRRSPTLFLPVLQIVLLARGVEKIRYDFPM
jgi:hypothetical protein